MGEPEKTDLDKAIEDSLQRPPPRQIRPSSVIDAPLSTQFDTLEKIRWELRQKYHTGRLALEEEYRRRKHEIESKWDRNMLQNQMDLEKAREDELARLAAEIREKLKPFEEVKHRLDL